MRLDTRRKKITVEGMPSIYLDIGRNNKGEVKDIFLSEPSKFDNTAIGKLICAVNSAIEQELNKNNDQN